MIKPTKQSVSLKIPVRADISGAFSDIPYYLEKYSLPGGEVVNVSLPVYLSITAEIGRTTDPITIDMPDLKEKIVGDLVDLAAQEKSNASQVAMNFIRLFALDSAGLKISVDSEGIIPPASGLGTSSAVGVGIVMALSQLYGLTGVNAPEFNYLIEQAMGVTGGKQDYYAPYLGGINHLKFYGPNSSLVQVLAHEDTDSKSYKWLMDRAVVYFSGVSRSSGVANAKPEDVIKKNPEILTEIADVAKVAHQAILDQDEKKLAAAIELDRENRLKLKNGYYNDLMWQLGKVAESHGFAHRGCGAGSGGCMLFFGDPAKKSALITDLTKISGRLVC